MNALILKKGSSKKSAYNLKNTASDVLETHTLAVLVDNESGVLARVIGLFSGRGYNIESLTVAETNHIDNLSRITIVTTGTPSVIIQIKAQLARMVAVHDVHDLTVEGPSVERELAMVKVVSSGESRVEALRTSEIFRASVVDTTLESFVFELTGTPEKIDAFVPGISKQNETTLGAANGTFTLEETLKSSFETGYELSKKITNNDNKTSSPTVMEKKSTTHDKFWCVPLPKGKTYKRFLDFQNDVAVSDVEIALKEGYRSIEHVKRYTTLGMATDQGKTSNLNGLQLVSNIENKIVPEVGHTTFRPPYTPVTIGAIVGREVGKHSKPTRKSPMHTWHEKNNAVFVDAGVWLRPRYYKIGEETLFEGSKREAKNVRTNVGVCDVTTLGKIDIKGPDAAELLNRVYTNAWLKLPVGKARYGVMLREDGIVMDDGTTTRISENHYHMTTTTAQAANVLSHLEYYLQLVWPELNVNVVSTTEQWAGAAIAGPKSRDLLQKLFPNIDASNEGLPFMGYLEADLFGVHARIFRISFSGELAYEVNVESDNGNFMWEKIMEVGQEFKIQPYGTEALSTLRIEMGHIAGSELDGRTIPYDNSLEGLVSKKKDFIGKRSLERKAFIAEDRQKVVGVVPIDKKTSIPEGSHLVKDAMAPTPNPKLGYISASCWSVEYDNPFSLAILKDGKNMIGQKLFAMSPLKNKTIPVEIVSSHYVDPKGERVRS